MAGSSEPWLLTYLSIDALHPSQHFSVMSGHIATYREWLAVAKTIYYKCIVHWFHSMYYLGYFTDILFLTTYFPSILVNKFDPGTFCFKLKKILPVFVVKTVVYHGYQV